MVKSVNPNVGIKGMDIVLSNLNREILAIKARSTVGLIEAAIVIRRDMDKTPPLIPIDLGNLRASWFTVTGHGFGAGSRGGQQSGSFVGPQAGELSAARSTAISEGRAIASAFKGPMVVMGFSANYAMWVHENMGATFQRPGAGPKFFEASLKRNKKKILQIIGANTQIP